MPKQTIEVRLTRPDGSLTVEQHVLDFLIRKGISRYTMISEYIHGLGYAKSSACVALHNLKQDRSVENPARGVYMVAA